MNTYVCVVVHVCMRISVYVCECMVGKTKEGETELIYLLDRLSLVTVSTITWDEVKRLLESTCDEDRGFNIHCAKEAARQVNEGNLQMNTSRLRRSSYLTMRAGLHLIELLPSRAVPRSLLRSQQAAEVDEDRRQMQKQKQAILRWFARSFEPRPLCSASTCMICGTISPPQRKAMQCKAQQSRARENTAMQSSAKPDSARQRKADYMICGSRRLGFNLWLSRQISCF